MRSEMVFDGSLEGLPAMLTVEEAARVLRIGRSLAYQLATRYLDSGSGTGRVDPDSSQHALPTKHHRGYSHWTNPFSLGIRGG
jgi:hypothetical protein